MGGSNESWSNELVQYGLIRIQAGFSPRSDRSCGGHIREEAAKGVALRWISPYRAKLRRRPLANRLF
jgi:hypothetical protein